MCVATTTIVAVSVAGASAAATAYAAHKGAEASHEAADIQSRAADKSLAFQKEQFDAQRNAFQPYQQAGVQATNQLRLGAVAPAPTFRPGQSQSLADFGPQASTQGPGLPIGQPGAPSPAPMKMQPQGQPGVGGAIGAQAQGAQPGGQVWTVQAPDGSTRQLPPEIAQQFIARGAKRIS